MDWHFPSDMLHFKSNQCSDGGFDGQPCDACTQLRHNQELKGLMPVANTPLPYLGFEALWQRYKATRKGRGASFFEIKKLQKQVLPMKERLTLFDRTD